MAISIDRVEPGTPSQTHLLKGHYSGISDGNMSFRFAGKEQSSKASVVTNRSNFLSGNGINPLTLTIMEAVNGSNVELLKPENLGGGVYSTGSMIKDTDAVVLRGNDIPGYSEVSLGIILADCLPVSGMNKDNGFMAHVGKKGVDLRVISKTLAFARSNGVNFEDGVINIGPGVKPCCYQKKVVLTNDPDIWAAHLRIPAEPNWEVQVRRTHLPQRYSQFMFIAPKFLPISMDITGAIIKNLSDNGIDPSKITIDPTCTSCMGREGLMYSHTVAKAQGHREGRALAVAQFSALG